MEDQAVKAPETAEEALQAKLTQSKQLNYALIAVIVIYLLLRLFLLVIADQQSLDMSAPLVPPQSQSQSAPPPAAAQIDTTKAGIEALTDNFDFLINYGLAYYEKKNYDMAISLTQEALLLRPDDPMALNNLGYYLFSSGRATESLKYLKRSYELDPTFQNVYNNLLYVYDALAQAATTPEAKAEIEREIKALQDSKPDLSKQPPAPGQPPQNQPPPQDAPAKPPEEVTTP